TPPWGGPRAPGRAYGSGVVLWWIIVVAVGNQAIAGRKGVRWVIRVVRHIPLMQAWAVVPIVKLIVLGRAFLPSTKPDHRHQQTSKLLHSKPSALGEKNLRR